MVTVALAERLPSLTVMVDIPGTVGAVNRPALVMEPPPAVTDHVTAGVVNGSPNWSKPWTLKSKDAPATTVCVAGVTAKAFSTLRLGITPTKVGLSATA